MEDLALFALLFAVYWSIVSWLLSDPVIVPNTQTAPALELKIATPAQAIVTAPEAKSMVQKSTKDLEQLLDGINIETLKLRPARRIAGKLGIQQKFSGKDAPLRYLRTQIRQRLEEQPNFVAPIIAQAFEAG